MAAKTSGAVLKQAGGMGHFVECLGFRHKGAVLAGLAAGAARIGGQPGVFQKRGQGGVGQAHAAVVLVIFAFGNNAKALGVAFKKGQVALLVGGEHIQKPLPPFLKPGANGALTGVAKGRVADVVGQAGGLNNIAEIGGADGVGEQLALLQAFSHANTESAPHAGNFQRVGKAIVHVVIGGQRMDLGLASQPPEGAGKNDLVVVAQKGGTTTFILGAASAQAGLVQ